MTYRLNQRKIEVTLKEIETGLIEIEMDCGSTIHLPNELLAKLPLSFYCPHSDSCKDNPNSEECSGVYEIDRDNGAIIAMCKFETKELYPYGRLSNSRSPPCAIGSWGHELR